MRSSQDRRKGATVSPSNEKRVESLLEQASDVEKQLASLPKANEEKAARLRSHLCEILSDILISDPAAGLDNDCTGRLWRNCFYSPIIIWRKKISREKRKQGTSLRGLEQNFKKFVGEAVTLYDYLIVQYQSKLIGETARSQTQTQDSAPKLAADSTHGIVPGLFRLYIHMGDLHRYTESYKKAEACYLNASKLAPGMGNPYNQLAVVSQMKDPNMSCVALYFYSRSLLATHDSFETSSSNLDRLFNLNRTYLEEHCRSTTPPVLSSEKKNPTDVSRTQKAAASKACLAHFVDFHYEIYRCNLNHKSQTSINEKSTDIIKSFESLLAASTFSDALLTRMVLVNVFSIESKRESKQVAACNAATDFLLLFGISLGNKLENVLTKTIEKSKKTTQSIRVLVPFYILCEYASQHVEMKSSSKRLKFWLVATSIANLALELLNSSTSTVVDSSGSHASCHKLLKGYRPYDFLFQPYVSGGPFIKAEEAVDALDVNMSQVTESGNSDVGPDTVQLLRQYVNICRRLSRDESCILTYCSGRFSCNDVAAQKTESSMATAEPSKGDLLAKAQHLAEITEAGDFVVLNNDTIAIQSSTPQEHETGKVVDSRSGSMNQFGMLLQPTSTALYDPPVQGTIPPPPPGFEHDPVNVDGGRDGAFQSDSASLIAPDSRAAIFTKGNNAGFNDFVSLPVDQLFATSSMDHIQSSLGQSFGMMNKPLSIETANPFSAKEHENAPLLSGIHGTLPAPSSFDGTPLLDSSLLESLFLSDPSVLKKSSNPFSR